MRCTQASLEALGIYGECPITGLGVLRAINAAGMCYFRMQFKRKQLDRRGRERWIDEYGQTVTVRLFVREHRVGKYYLETDGHAMALVDGVLIDAAERGADGRWIKDAFQVM